MAVQLGLSLMVEDGFAQAVLPLFEDGAIDALEYSFEIGWSPRGLPAWATALLDHYGEAGRLWGHGVTMSPLSADNDEHHDRWLSRVADACQRWSFNGVSEHYGFMREGSLHGGAPLPPPAGSATNRRGAEALRRLAETTGVPVGLENLALALSERDVWAQGPAITAMLEAVDGYLVLDLHNLDCQVRNFGVDPIVLLESFPLDRVRCLHVSGGSWSHPKAGGKPRRFRRDTHDTTAPASVLELLPAAVARCPSVQTVIIERLGPTVVTAADQVAVRDEALAIRALLREAP